MITNAPAQTRPDPAHDILSDRHQGLEVIFSPRNVAVIGATERPKSVGRTLLWNLISSPFGGTVFPVNPKRSSILGIKAYPNLAAVPDPVDLAIIATPAAGIPEVMQDCIAAGVRGAIVLSAGFKEIGPEGVALEQQVLAAARRGKIRLIGPNCLGVMNPHSGLNATFASAMAQPGNVGFISQSGALCTSILDWSFRENVGFSAFVSLGSMLDVGWGDLIDYLGNDPQTHSIVIYMESIGDARSFLSAAREVALAKPIIVIKAGRTQAAAEAAASHTGALAGSDDVLDAAFRRCGVLRVDTIDELFNLAEVLAKQPRPRGRKLSILTNAGGPGVLATDALIRSGGELAILSEDTKQQLDAVLPPHWSHHNPIDILGDATPERYAEALKIVAQDPDSDGLLVILTPQAMTDPTQTAKLLSQAVADSDKPILASWMGGETVAAGEKLLNQANLFTLPYPDTAAQVFTHMWRYSDRLNALYETPRLSADEPEPDRASVQALIETVRGQGRTLLTEAEAKQVMAAYGIPTVPTYTARTPEAAVTWADQIGYPVVLKLWSETITHKTDVGGVKLNLSDATAVRNAYHEIANTLRQARPGEADTAFLGVTVQPMLRREGYELILGSSLDPQFGPVLLFGSGGTLVEIFRDRALALPPLNTTLARRLMERTQIYKALQGVRGQAPIDLKSLELLLVRFSYLVAEQSWIKDIDINPLLVRPSAEAIALDARILLHAGGDACATSGDASTTGAFPKTAIRPYPRQYSHQIRLNNGQAVKLLPIRPEDEPLLVKFHQLLSDESVYLRYAHLMKLSHRVAHHRLTRVCFIDYDRELAFVAKARDPETQEPYILGISRLSRQPHTNIAELSMLVGDRYQNLSLGSQMIQHLLRVAREEQLDQITAYILPENRHMQHLCEKVGFKLTRAIDDDMVEASLSLKSERRL